MQLSPAIFKAYDIRGIVPSTINDKVARGLGRAFGAAARAEGQTTVAVGRDGRLSGAALANALMLGLAEAGMEVIDIGLCTTPMLYFAASTLCKSGIQVTGSHNPKDYNGFKMVLNGRAIFGEEIQQLRRAMEEDRWEIVPGGSMGQANLLPAYRERIVADIQLARPMKIVVDSGNGIAGASAPDVLVQRVIGQLKALGAASVRRMQGVEEHVRFPLPKGLGGTGLDRPLPGQRADIEPLANQTLPPAPYGSEASPEAAELLKLDTLAAPERSVELRRRSEERQDDPFDLPPE